MRKMSNKGAKRLYVNISLMWQPKDFLWLLFAYLQSAKRMSGGKRAKGDSLKDKQSKEKV